MGPKDSRDSAETNGNVHPGGKGKGKAKGSRTPSIPSLQDLTPEAIDNGLEALRRISGVLCFVQGYGAEISNVEGVYEHCLNQQARIDKLDTIVAELTFRKDQEMERLRDETKTYQANARQVEWEKKELDREQASLEDRRKAMQSELERQKEKEISETKQEFSDKYKTRVKQMREEFEKKIQALEMDNGGLKDDIKELEERNKQALEDLNQQKERLELDKRSSQSHIIRLESELHQINAASTASPQTPEFYIDGFHQLWKGIRDVADNDFRFLPEDTKPLESEAVREQLSSASKIFMYPPLSTESPVATFLRACAIQNFLSTKIISIIRRHFYAEPTAAVERKSRTQPMDSILNTISNVPAVTSSQDLSWRLTTVDKLDLVGSHSPSATTNISTEPNQCEIVEEIWDHLHYFQSKSDQTLNAKLSEIASMTIKLWGALRKDSCRVDFDYDPSTGDRQEWEFIDDVSMSSFKAADSPSEIPVAQLPSKPFVLFPRITGSFGLSSGTARSLHAGSALSHDSPAFRAGLQEIQHIDYATKEFKRRLRSGSSAQSSPDKLKRQGEWPAPHRGYN